MVPAAAVPDGKRITDSRRYADGFLVSRLETLCASKSGSLALPVGLRRIGASKY